MRELATLRSFFENRRDVVGSMSGPRVAQEVIDAAPDGMVYRHVSFFDRPTGHWIGEWAGYLPPPEPAEDAVSLFTACAQATEPGA